MKTICDTNILLFWADQRHRLTPAARAALDTGAAGKDLACSDISLWEIAILFRKGRLVLPAGHTPAQYMDDIARSLDLAILPITPAIAARAESGIVPHADPADRLIAATTLVHGAALVTADEKLRALPNLRCIW